MIPMGASDNGSGLAVSVTDGRPHGLAVRMTDGLRRGVVVGVTDGWTHELGVGSRQTSVVNHSNGIGIRTDQTRG